PPLIFRGWKSFDLATKSWRGANAEEGRSHAQDQEQVMKLNEAQISRTLSQFPAQVLAEDHPAVAQFCELFGHHTLLSRRQGTERVGAAAGSWNGSAGRRDNKPSGLERCGVHQADHASARTEPPRVCRRPVGLSYAAMADRSSMA